MKRNEIERAINALELADKKLFDDKSVTIRVYNEVSDYIGIAKDILTRARAQL